eukprot:1391991-Amorphochlora_amoeboformis.AAC.1
MDRKKVVRERERKREREREWKHTLHPTRRTLHTPLRHPRIQPAILPSIKLLYPLRSSPAHTPKPPQPLETMVESPPKARRHHPSALLAGFREAFPSINLVRRGFGRRLTITTRNIAMRPIRGRASEEPSMVWVESE